MLPAIIENYQEKAIHVARVVMAVLGNGGSGTDPAMIRGWKLTKAPLGNVWLFAELDETAIPRYEPYAQAAHRISTSLRGIPVYLGNHTGLRYGILLSKKPQLPTSVDFPGWKQGMMQLGVDMRGQSVEIGYGDISHTLVAGITQFGKSNLLRLMAIQARAEGWKLALADPDGRTFTKFEHDEALLFPVGKTLDGCVAVIGQVQELIELRARLYSQASNSPDGLDEYNEWAHANQATPLQPVLVVLDEFNGTVLGTGGIRGAFASAATQVAWRAAKFGIRLVLAGQDFSKDIVGPVREQMTTRICLRVSNERVSDVVLGKPGAERLALPGRALTNRWGAMQVYFVPKEMMTPVDANGLTAEEMKIAQFVTEKYAGRMTMEALQDFGITQRQARRLRVEWMDRKLAKIMPEQDNALCLTVKVPSASQKSDAQTGLCVGAGSCGPSGLDGDGDENG